MKHNELKDLNELSVYKAKDTPLYEGVFEVYNHKNCPLLLIARSLDSEILINVMRQGEKESHIRFSIDSPLHEIFIKDILKPLVKKHIISKANVWIGNNTIWEVDMAEEILQMTAKLINRPMAFFDNYLVSPEVEKFRLFLPGNSGRKEILNLDRQFERLGWNAELIDFGKRDEIDIYKKAFDALERIPLWINPEEISIVNKAVSEGYFEQPKRIKLAKLADELNIPRSTLNRKLRSINRKLVMLTLKEIGRTRP
jgi:hypothetical protein